MASCQGGHLVAWRKPSSAPRAPNCTLPSSTLTSTRPPSAAVIMSSRTRASSFRRRTLLYSLACRPQARAHATRRHALLAARFDILRGRPPPLVRAVQEYFVAIARLTRAHQARACRLAPIPPAGSQLLTGCDADYLGWAAVAILAERRPATLGRAPMRRAADQRLVEARRRCGSRRCG